MSSYLMVIRSFKRTLFLSVCIQPASAVISALVKERSGQKVRRIGSSFGLKGEFPLLKGHLCYSVKGFSLHAARKIKKHKRSELEDFIGYGTRPPLAVDRLSMTEIGEIKYELKRKFNDGTTHILLSPSLSR